MNKKERQRYARATFVTADHNGDGVMDLEEVVDLIRRISAEMHLQLPPVDRIRKLVRLCDKSGEGNLQRDDFFSCFKAILESAVRHACVIKLQAGIRSKLARLCTKRIREKALANALAQAILTKALATEPPNRMHSFALTGTHDTNGDDASCDGATDNGPNRKNMCMNDSNSMDIKGIYPTRGHHPNGNGNGNSPSEHGGSDRPLIDEVLQDAEEPHVSSACEDFLPAPFDAPDLLTSSLQRPTLDKEEQQLSPRPRRPRSNNNNEGSDEESDQQTDQEGADRQTGQEVRPADQQTDLEAEDGGSEEVQEEDDFQPPSPPPRIQPSIHVRPAIRTSASEMDLMRYAARGAGAFATSAANPHLRFFASAGLRCSEANPHIQLRFLNGASAQRRKRSVSWDRQLADNTESDNDLVQALFRLFSMFSCTTSRK